MRRRRAALLTLLLLVGLLAVPVFLTWREVRQERLNYALIMAAKHLDSRAVVTLLALGADANARDLPIEKRPVWRLLLDRMKGKSPILSDAPTALIIVASIWDENANDADKTTTIKELLKAGADVRARDGLNVEAGHLNSTALMLVAHTGPPECLKLLLQAGAEVNARDISKYTALEEAVTSNRWDKMEAIRLLLQYHADVNAHDNAGMSPLSYAEAFAYDVRPANQIYVKIIQILKKAGARK